MQTPAGDRSLKLAQEWASRVPRPYREREMVTTPLITGLRVIDTFFPIAKGGTAMIPGGFGTGKTMTQHSLAKWCDADIIVYIGCGERGNEMTDVLTVVPGTGGPEVRPPADGAHDHDRQHLEHARRGARGLHLHRHHAGRVLPRHGLRRGRHGRLDLAAGPRRCANCPAAWRKCRPRKAIPAYLPTRLAQFYERAGSVVTLCGRRGSVRIVGAVSPMGGDFSEPVTQHTRRFIRCFWALDTDLAYSRHYPAIHWLKSYSEYVDDVTEWWEERGPGLARPAREGH